MSKTRKSTARYAAVHCLVQLEKTRSPIKQIFVKSVDQLNLATKDKHLAMNLIYGVLRQKDYLDSLLSKLCKQPLSKIKTPVYQALCVGLYQLVFLDRIPDSAAVNESVNALKAMKTPQRLIGFTNGVLRGFTRQKDNLPTPKAPVKQTDILNHPRWLTSRWASNYGAEAMVSICANNTSEPTLSLRINESQISRDDFLARLHEKEINGLPGEFAPASVLLPDFQGGIDKIPGFGTGQFQVQDQAAQLASLILHPNVTGKYLDGCAGLGGKTTHIAELIHQKGELGETQSLWAVEPDIKRFAKLQENLTVSPIHKSITCVNKDLNEFSKSGVTFDGILIDAPCSGTGVTGRHPDIRWNRSETDLDKYSTEQTLLLQTAAKMIHRGGILVYATCSIEPEENDQVVARFLELHPEFMLDEISPYLPDSSKRFVRDGFFAPLPSKEIDGFFAARLIRKT